MSFYPRSGENVSEVYVHPRPVRCPASVLGLLDRLHAESSEQERAIDRDEVARVGFANYTRDKYIALDQDKCWFVYQTCLAIGARNVVELWRQHDLPLACGPADSQDTRGQGEGDRYENEPDKAARARATWREAGERIADLIDLREGDLRETLKDDPRHISCCLTVSVDPPASPDDEGWAPLALPALQVVEPRFRPGAVVICDNSISSSARYADLQTYMRDPKNGYTNMTIPYHNGLEMSVFMGK